MEICSIRLVQINIEEVTKDYKWTAILGEWGLEAIQLFWEGAQFPRRAIHDYNMEVYRSRYSNSMRLQWVIIALGEYKWSISNC